MDVGTLISKCKKKKQMDGQTLEITTYPQQLQYKDSRTDQNTTKLRFWVSAFPVGNRQPSEESSRYYMELSDGK